MTSIEKIKLNKTVPTTLIYKGGNCLGKEVTTNLIEQGGFVIVIDEMSKENISNFKEQIDSNLFLYLDFVGLDELKNELERLDYIVFIDDIEKDVSEKIGTDFFLKSSNDLNKVLKISLHFKSKFVLASSLKIHQVLVNMQSPEFKRGRNSLEYNRAELQRYSESLVNEFIEKANLNARIVRIGELVGSGVPLNIPSELVRLIKLSVNGRKLNLIGDGLQSNYLVALKDAAHGLLKSLFEDQTKGKIYSICYPQEITSLSLAYKITEIEDKAGQIVFDESEEHFLEPINFENSTNLSEIGWNPKINLERAISQEIEWVNTYYGGKRSDVLKKEVEEMEPMKHENKAPIAPKEVKFPKGKDETHNFINKLSEVTKSKSRNSKIVLSDKLLREKLKEKEIKEHKEFDRTTFSYKFNYWIRTLTFGKVFTYLMIFVLSFILYFLILSPLVRSVKNVYEIYRTANDTTVTLNNSDLRRLSSSSTSLVTDIENAKVIFDVFRLNDLYNNLRNNFNIVKEYSGNALLIDSKFESVKTYFETKDVDTSLSITEFTDLKKLSISDDKLMKDSQKIAASKIGEIDTSVKKIRELIETKYFKPSENYISFEEQTTLFNIYEDNLGYLVLYSTLDAKDVKTVTGYAYFNNQKFNEASIVSGKFDDTFKLPVNLKADLESILNSKTLTSNEKRTKSLGLIEYFNNTLALKVDTVFVIDYEFNPSLLGDSTVSLDDVQTDEGKAISKIQSSTDLTSKIKISSLITQNYLSRSVEFLKLTDYLNLYLTGLEGKDIALFTIRDI